MLRLATTSATLSEPRGVRLEKRKRRRTRRSAYYVEDPRLYIQTSTFPDELVEVGEKRKYARGARPEIAAGLAVRRQRPATCKKKKEEGKGKKRGSKARDAQARGEDPLRASYR